MMFRGTRLAGCVVGLIFAWMAQGQSGPEYRSLGWLTYLPGNHSDAARAIQVDRDGNIWIAGSTSSKMDFPGPNDPFQSAIKGGSDIFLAKYRPEPDGRSTLLFWTWIGGTGDEDVRAMALDEQGRVYLTGSTSSEDFPTTNGAPETERKGGADAYLVVVDPSQGGQSSLVFGTYLGGSGADIGYALALYDGDVFVTGATGSNDFTGTGNGLQGSNRGGTDAFLVRISPFSEGPLQYFTYLGGAGADTATGIAIDSEGIVWISGYTSSEDFPVVEGSHQLELRGRMNGFLSGIDLRRTGLDALIYGSFFGGTYSDFPTQMKMDAQGSLWIGGYTLSGDFPTTAGAFSQGLAGQTDAFVLKLNPKGDAGQFVAYGTLLGGVGAEVLYAMVPLADGRIAVAGYNLFGDFPATPQALQLSPRSIFEDSFIAILNPQASGLEALPYATYFGGTYTDIVTSIAADDSGHLYFAGYTYSKDLGVTDGSWRNSPGASAFAARLKKD